MGYIFMYLAAEGIHVFCRNATEACSLFQMSSSLVPPLCSMFHHLAPGPSILYTSGFPMFRFYSQHLTQCFRSPILKLLHHESLEEGFNNCVPMLIYFYIDYNLVISNVFIFDTTFLIAICRQIVLDRKKFRKEEL